MFYFVKKILPVILILSCLISLSSCQLEEFDKQNMEQTSVQATEQTTETVKNDDSDDTEETTEITPQKVINSIFISKSGVLRLEYDPKLEPPYSITAMELTNVKKCMARNKSTQAMLTLDRKKPQGQGANSYFDYIYVVFEEGYKLTAYEKKIIKEYGIAYGFE